MECITKAIALITTKPLTKNENQALEWQVCPLLYKMIQDHYC